MPEISLFYMKTWSFSNIKRKFSSGLANTLHYFISGEETKFFGNAWIILKFHLATSYNTEGVCVKNLSGDKVIKLISECMKGRLHNPS